MRALQPSIATLVPLVMVLIALVTAVALGVPVYLRISGELESTARVDLESLLASRQRALRDHLDGIRNSVLLNSGSLAVLQAAVAFDEAWRETSEEVGHDIAKDYLDDNTYAFGQRHLMMMGRSRTAYDKTHRRHHRLLRKVAFVHGFADLMLLGVDGRVIYSVAKTDDFGAVPAADDPRTGELARLLVRINADAEEGVVALTDVSFYPPAGQEEDVPTFFAGMGIRNRDGDYLGAFVVRVGAERLDELMQVATGASTVSYIVGEDRLMRSNPRSDRTPATLRTHVNTVATEEVWSGVYETHVIEDHRGIRVLSAAGLFEYDQFRWAVLAEKNEADVLAPVHAMRRTVTWLALAVVLATSVIGVALSRRLVRPIAGMSTAMRKLSRGDLDADVPTRSKLAEVAEMSSAFRAFREGAVERLKAERVLSAVIDSTPSAIVIKDIDGRFSLVNREFERWYALPRDQVLGKHHKLTADRHVSDAIDAQERAAIASQAASTRELQWPDGRTVLSTRFPVADHHGEVVQVGAVEHDITERRKAEDAMQRLNEELEARVETRTEALRIARDDAQAATRAKDEFLATMSHEIRTPMNGVVGMIDLLDRTVLNEDQREMLHTVKDSSGALLGIINDILDFSKIEAGKLSLESIDMSVSNVIGSLADTFVPIANASSLDLLCYVDPKLPAMVKGDPTRLRQVLTNLLGNALKFTERGRVMLKASALPCEQSGKARIKYEVVDQGIGMTPEHVAQLFQPFTQAESSTTRRFGGTGLGLSICAKLVELMGGHIEVQSTVGEGSTFTALVDHEISGEAVRDPLADSLQGVRVLLACADADRACFIAEYLQFAGASVERADAAPGHAERQNSRKYDVFLLDSAATLPTDAGPAVAHRSDAAPTPRALVRLVYPRRDTSNADAPTAVELEAAPLRREAVLRAVARAAGKQATPQSPDAALLRQSKTAPTVDEARASGQLILVAEDNAVNRTVIVRQLNVLGYAAETANDGVLALEAWRSGSYALLLCDCHMPNLDGYGLTSAVREAEADGAARMPIIAVTANALVGEAEKCRAAGMDDYLTKPLDMDRLKQTLEKWMPGGADGDAGGGIPTQTPSMGKSADPANNEIPVDLSFLTECFGDDHEIHREILQEFMASTPDYVDNIGDALTEGEAGKVASLAHALKSAARTVGANELADLCQGLEYAGKADNWVQIKTLAPRLKPAMDNVSRFIAEF